MGEGSCRGTLEDSPDTGGRLVGTGVVSVEWHRHRAWREGCRGWHVVLDGVSEWNSWLGVSACRRDVLDSAEQTGAWRSSKGGVFDQSKG